METQQISGWVFNALALLFFGIVVYLLLWGKNFGNASLATILAAFCAVMGNPDRFETMKFSISGIETKSREAIRQVQVTLLQLQNLAATLAEGNLTQLAFSGQVFVGISTAEKFRIRDQVVEQLRALGVKTDDIVKSQRVWINVYCNILEGQIGAAVRKEHPEVDTKNEFVQLAKGDSKDGLPTPDALRKWVAQRSVDDPKIGELLTEYESVWTTGAMNNPDLIPFGSIPRVLNEP